jgi:hypothetical protein
MNVRRILVYPQNIHHTNRFSFLRVFGLFYFVPLSFSQSVYLYRNVILTLQFLFKTCTHRTHIVASVFLFIFLPRPFFHFYFMYTDMELIILYANICFAAEFLTSVSRHVEACEQRVRAAELSPNDYSLVVSAATALRLLDRKVEAEQWYRTVNIIILFIYLYYIIYIICYALYIIYIIIQYFISYSISIRTHIFIHNLLV